MDVNEKSECALQAVRGETVLDRRKREENGPIFRHARATGIAACAVETVARIALPERMTL